VRSCAALLFPFAFAFATAFAGLVAAGLVACGITADFSGLQTGGHVSVGPDADATPETDATVDAPARPEAGDAGAPDSGPDSGKGFCASLTTAVKLCDDFDEGQPLDAGWGATDTYGGSAISLNATAFSAPSAFFSAVNPSGAPSSARLLQAVPTFTTPHVHVEFEMLLTPSDGTFELAAVHQVTADGTTYGFYYREVKNALQVQLRALTSDGTLVDQSWPIGAPSTGWVRVDMDIDVSASGTLTVQHDGKVVLNETNQSTSTPTRTAMFVELGFYTFDPASGQALFDNAIVDWP
jgi:hypothetical protein